MGSGCSLGLQAFRGERNFTIGSRSDEESFPPVAVGVARLGRHASATWSPDWPEEPAALRGVRTDPKPPPGSQIAAEGASRRDEAKTLWVMVSIGSIEGRLKRP
jgi:hypothetical protein